MQYAEQMLAIFSNSSLIVTMFQFFVGLPLLRRNSDYIENDKSIEKKRGPLVSQLRLSVGLKDGRVSIGIKPRGTGSTRASEIRGDSAGTLSTKYLRTTDAQSQSNNSPEMDFSIPDKGSLLGNFNMRMRKIQLEHANMNTNLALNGPKMSHDQIDLTGSEAFSRAQSDIKAKKVDNIISLMDSVLQKNKEEDDDDVLFGDDANSVDNSEDVFSPDIVNDLKVDYTYNRDEHQSLTLFRLLAAPPNEEKIPVVVLKIIEDFILKQIPSILDFFIFESLQKLLQRTDWLKPLGERIVMRPIDELKRKFISKFKMTTDFSPQQLPAQVSKVPILYYINHENLVSGNQQERFDSRKTKVKDEEY